MLLSVKELNGFQGVCLTKEMAGAKLAFLDVVGSPAAARQNASRNSDPCSR